MRIHRRELIRYGAATVVAGLPLARAAAADAQIFVNKIAVADGRLLMAALVEGKGPYFFALDTGSSISLIHDSLAKRLGLGRAIGSRQVYGIGGVSDYSWYAAKEVRLASGIHFDNMVLAGMRDAMGGDIVGLFGVGLFTSYDSDLDLAKGEWRAYPKGRPNFDGMQRLPSRFMTNAGAPKIEVRAAVDGFEDWFAVDTGSPGTLLISGNTAKRSGLWDDVRPYAPAAARGFGKGAVPTRVVRAKRIKLGPYVLENRIVRLLAPGNDLGGTSGLVGLATLGLFNLSTRVSDGSLWAAPNGMPQPPEGYSLSGLWLSERKGRVIVDDVGTGSPAAAAGVRKGDVLVGGDLKEAIRAAGGPAGKQVSLKIERDGATRDIGYTLAPWL